jgi:hypothetical protein
MRAGELVGGRYEIELPAARGGMSTVFRARDTVTGEAVAVKVVLDPEEPTDLRRFEREARTLLSLRHPGIVRYIGHGTTGGGDPYLVMEWIEGETLRARLRRGPLSAREALRIAGRAARALGATHRAGIVHRDVKPANLMLEGWSIDRVVLLDFGLARRRSASLLTAPGAVLGTPGYLAPEQARAEALDARADVFALGCVLFECLTGEPPFSAPDAQSLVLALLFEPPPRCRARRPDVPAALDDLVARMMARPRDQRPADGAAVAAELAALDPEAAGDEERGGGERAGSAWISDAERRLHAMAVAQGPVAGTEADLDAVCTEFGARVVPLGVGAWGLVAAGAGSGQEAAERLARAAVALARRRSDLSVSLVAERSDAGAGAALAGLGEKGKTLVGRRHGEARVRVDETSLRLLEAGFEVRRDRDGALLLGPRSRDTAPPGAERSRATPDPPARAPIDGVLASLPPGERRALRAASVLGDTFWAGAVEAIAGPGSADALRRACDRGLLIRRRESRFPGETEYAFTIDRAREAAYAALTREDRALAHALAARWLERAGERDAAVLAAHCERGDLFADAARLRAQALSTPRP